MLIKYLVDAGVLLLDGVIPHPTIDKNGQII